MAFPGSDLLHFSSKPVNHGQGCAKADDQAGSEDFGSSPFVIGWFDVRRRRCKCVSEAACLIAAAATLKG
jgi:hypothetical protein